MTTPAVPDPADNPADPAPVAPPSSTTSTPESVPDWERKPDEPSLWYARFEVYRLMGPSRTIDGAHRQDGVKKGDKRTVVATRWYAMASEWRWKQRAEAWDAVQREANRARRAREIEESQDRHVNIARIMLAKGIERLQAIDPADLSVTEARVLVVAGAHMERVSLNEPAITELERLFKELAEGLRGGGV